MTVIDSLPEFSFREVMSLHVQVLGSSSGGNCTLLWSGRSAVLVDFGFGPRYIGEGLERNGLHWSDLRAVLLTHIHNDHIDFFTLKRLAEHKVPVIAPAGVIQALRKHYGALLNLSRGILEPLPKSRVRELDAFQFTAFEVPHDASGGCYGYRVLAAADGGPRQAAIATDLAYADDGLPLEFAGSDIIVLESNHDPDMLENSGRPAWLKKRIREVGHLSNQQSADLMGRILSASAIPPQGIMLAHISQECNTEPIAHSVMTNALQSFGFPTLHVAVSHASAPSVRISVQEDRPVAE
jgi:phosphoribosyl 1,2-cyclic phosphodiesterase